MLDGFNEGWIEFENGEQSSRKGHTELKTMLKQLVARIAKTNTELHNNESMLSAGGHGLITPDRGRRQTFYAGYDSEGASSGTIIDDRNEAL